jgi:phosphoribosylanthranilate isomerase
MNTLVKICGLRSAETVEAALGAGAAFIGFVFFPKSPRDISLSRAAELGRFVRGKTQIVALVVDPDDTLLDSIVEQLRPDIIQLHGHESVERVREIDAKYKVRLWKAVPVATAQDVSMAAAYSPHVEQIVFDARPPLGAIRPGGNAQAFDWTLLKGLDHSHSFVLSGGLNVDNIGQAIRVTRAPIVDVSSGVETAPGQKDASLIQKFIEAVKSCKK